MHLETEAALYIWALLDDAYYVPGYVAKIRCTNLGLPALPSPRLRMEAALALQEILTEFWRIRPCGLVVAGKAFNPPSDYIDPTLMDKHDVTVRVIRADDKSQQSVDPKKEESDGNEH